MLFLGVKLLSRVRFFATPCTVAYQASPSMGFSRQGYWSGLPFPSLGDLPDPGITPRSPTLQADALHSGLPGELWVPSSPLRITWTWPQLDFHSRTCSCCLVAKSCVTLLCLHELEAAKLLSLWDFPGKTSEVGCQFLLWGIFPT